MPNSADTIWKIVKQEMGAGLKKSLFLCFGKTFLASFFAGKAAHQISTEGRRPPV